LQGSADKKAVFDYFFRKLPFRGGYVVFAGMGDLLRTLEDLHFSADAIAYLRSAGLNDDYPAPLRNFRCPANVQAPREGDVVFPGAPIVRIEGTLLETQLVETLLLNTLNFQSLVATKAARIKSVAGNKILSDFGLRRAQGLGGYHAARAAII